MYTLQETYNNVYFFQMLHGSICTHVKISNYYTVQKVDMYTVVSVLMATLKRDHSL